MLQTVVFWGERWADVRQESKTYYMQIPDLVCNYGPMIPLCISSKERKEVESERKKRKKEIEV